MKYEGRTTDLTTQTGLMELVRVSKTYFGDFGEFLRRHRIALAADGTFWEASTTPPGDGFWSPENPNKHSAWELLGKLSDDKNPSDWRRSWALRGYRTMHDYAKVTK